MNRQGCANSFEHWNLSTPSLAAAGTCAAHPEYPTLHPRESLLRSGERWLEERCEPAIVVRLCERGRNAVGIVLVLRSIFALKAAAPEGRVDFSNDRLPRRNVPAVKRPKADPLPQSLTDQA